MRSKNTFSVLFWVDQKRAADNEGIIYARVTVNKKRVNISLKQKASLNLWDAKMKKLKGAAIGNQEKSRNVSPTVLLSNATNSVLLCSRSKNFHKDRSIRSDAYWEL